MWRHLHDDKFSDHQHDIAWNHDEEAFDPVAGFDYDAIDRNVFGNEPDEDTVSFSDMCAALSLIVGWATASPDLSHVGDPVYLTGT
jgi:hypothetical protein